MSKLAVKGTTRNSVGLEHEIFGKDEIKQLQTKNLADKLYPVCRTANSVYSRPSMETSEQSRPSWDHKQRENRGNPENIFSAQ